MSKQLLNQATRCVSTLESFNCFSRPLGTAWPVASRAKQAYTPQTSLLQRVQHLRKSLYISDHYRSMASLTVAGSRVPIEPQAVDAPLTKCAIFLTLVFTKSDPNAIEKVQTGLSSVSDLSKNVSIRDLSANFACTAAIGSDAWDEVTSSKPRPAELHPFKEFKGRKHTAVSTPGDLFFHIRADRHDLCFEFERQLLDVFGSAVSTVDETVGFRYFDTRDLLGFVDGTANPAGQAVSASTLVAAGEGNDSAVGGSYVVVQKYLHDLAAWRKLSAEQQESIIGRTKVENIELDDAPTGQQLAHKSLATVEDEEGNEHDILRDNMPFGSPGSAEFGTYFIGYSSKLWVTEKMLERMFVGEPEGMHDRILDFSRPVTGATFFAPSADVLDSLGG